jgi:hypothetical protein
LAAATVLFSARQTDLARLPVRLVDLSAAESATTSVSVVEVGSVRGDAATRYVIKDGWFCEDATSELNVLVASESEAGTVTAKDCRAACDAEPKCALFFGSDSGNCYLHEAGSAAAGTEWKDICTEFGKGYFVGHALAACADAPTVANGDADAAEFSFFVGLYEFGPGGLRDAVGAGLYQPAACASALVLGDLGEASLWHDLMRKLGGANADIEMLAPKLPVCRNMPVHVPDESTFGDS